MSWHLPGNVTLTWDWAGPIAALFAFVAVWLAVAAFTGWLAGRKGRDDGAWFVFGFFLGPLALLTILLAPPAPPLRAAGTDSPRAKTKPCPGCAQTNDAVALACRFCGREFTQST